MSPAFLCDPNDTKLLLNGTNQNKDDWYQPQKRPESSCSPQPPLGSAASRRSAPPWSAVPARTWRYAGTASPSGTASWSICDARQEHPPKRPPLSPKTEGTRQRGRSSSFPLIYIYSIRMNKQQSGRFVQKCLIFFCCCINLSKQPYYKKEKRQIKKSTNENKKHRMSQK